MAELEVVKEKCTEIVNLTNEIRTLLNIANHADYNDDEGARIYVDNYKNVLRKRIEYISAIREVFIMHKFWVPNKDYNVTSINWVGFIVTGEMGEPKPFDTYEFDTRDSYSARYIADGPLGNLWQERFATYIRHKTGRNELITPNSCLDNFRDDLMNMIEPCSLEDFTERVKTTAKESKIILLKMAKSVDQETDEALKIINEINITTNANRD